MQTEEIPRGIWERAYERLRTVSTVPEGEDPLLTMRQIGQLAGVADGTVRVWRGRALALSPQSGRIPMPPPDHGGGRAVQPLWRLSTVLGWMHRTGRRVAIPGAPATSGRRS